MVHSEINEAQWGTLKKMAKWGIISFVVVTVFVIVVQFLAAASVIKCVETLDFHMEYVSW